MSDSLSPGSLFVVSAASGTGKTSLVKSLLEQVNGLAVSISHTTREPRKGEIDGKHYHFTDVDTFLESSKNGQFIEYAQVFDNYYGTMHKSVEEQLAAGIDIILEIDWQGAEQVRKIFSNSISIFILPPSKDTLRKRLAGRAQDSEEVIEKRLNGSLQEMKQYINFDYLVVNNDFEDALADLQAIIVSHRLHMHKQIQQQQDLLISLFSD